MTYRLSAALVSLSITAACGPLGRLVDDPSRICPPGHVLVMEDGQPACVPRPPVVVEPTPTNTPVIPDSSPSPTPTHAPTPTPGPTPTPAPVPPDVTPTPAPTPAGLCMLDSPPWTRPASPPTPVKVLGTPGVACPRGFRRVGPDRSGQLGCVIDWPCAPGELGRSPAEGAQVSLAGNHVVIDSDGHIRDADNGRPCGMDAWGRQVCGGRVVPLEHDGREVKWWDARACDPVRCGPEPTATPAGPTPTPTPGSRPTPFYPPIQPADFRLNFVNGCNHLRYPRLVNNDQDVLGQCDTTPRYIGTLESGDRWGNACDPDHYRCAVEACPDLTPEQQIAHRKTYELCAGREWLTTAGTRIEAPGVLIEQDEENPYQHWLTAPRGAEIEVRACLAVVPLVTTDGLLVASGDGCGAPKPVKFEVPRR